VLDYTADVLEGAGRVGRGGGCYLANVCLEHPPPALHAKTVIQSGDAESCNMQEMKDLVKKILVPNPAQRLGVLKGGVTDVKEHPWFASFDWKSFAAGTMRAPYVPRVPPPPPFSFYSTSQGMQNGCKLLFQV